MDNSTIILGNTLMINNTTAMPNLTEANTTDVMTNNKGTVAATILNIGLPILLPIGLIGNGLSFVILIQYSKTSAFYVCLSVLAISDFLLMILGLLPRWLHQSGLYDFFPTDIAYSCSYVFYPFLVFSQFSSSVTAAATIERYVAIAHPLTAARYYSRNRAIMYLTIIFLVIAAVNFPTICFQWDATYTQCLLPQFTNDFCSKSHMYIDAILYFILPAVLIILFNILLVQALYSAAKLRRTLMNSQKNQVRAGEKDDRDKTKQTVTTLFLVTAVFLLSLFPVAGGTLYVALSNKNSTIEDVPNVAAAVDLCSLINHAVNFILYGLSGKMFRGKLYSTVCCCIKSE